jgi:hypothetical protein
MFDREFNSLLVLNKVKKKNERKIVGGDGQKVQIQTKRKATDRTRRNSILRNVHGSFIMLAIVERSIQG